MSAEPVMNERHVRDAATFVEIVIRRLPRPLRGSKHRLEYRLALVSRGDCVLRYDNEAGKRNHRRVGHVDERYGFTDSDVFTRRLLARRGEMVALR